MARRTGLTTIRQITYRLCRLITKWTPTILLIYPDNVNLKNALILVNGACGELIEAIDESLPEGV